MLRFPVWVALGLIAAVLDGHGADDPHAVSTFVYSMVVILLGVTMFWRHGGSVITAAGTYCLASAVFIGFSGLYYWSQSSPVTDAVFIGVSVGYWVTVVLTPFWPDLDFPERIEVSNPDAGWLLASSIVALPLTLVLVSQLTGISGAVPVHLTLGVFTLVLLAAMLYRSPRPLLRAAVLGVVLLWVFVSTVFTGYGRLSLVSLALAAAVLASLRLSGRGVKALVLAGAAPALLVMVRMREQFGVREYGEELSGIGSVVTPVRDFGRLVLALRSGIVEHGGVEPFVATALFWVPRSLWPGKPVGFGSTLTQILEPQLAPLGQSMAALSQGEFFYALGWMGVVIGIVLTGLYVRLLDRSLLSTARAGAVSRRRLLLLCALIVVIGDLPNLVWAGSYGHFSRIVLRLVPLFVLVPFLRVRRSTKVSHPRPVVSGR